MIVRRDRKVPGGKLLRVEIELVSGTVLAVAVKGDFFAYPEEAFEAAEAELAGTPADQLGSFALSLFSRPPLMILGADAGDIADLLVEAADEAKAD